MADSSDARARMAAPADDPLIGHLVDGRYRIRRRVARGGMASVYEATDLRLERLVAVKVMHAGLGDDDEFAARFVREARSAARIDHPNVVSVFDQGDDDGIVYLVMEYVPGRTLRDVIRSEAPLTPARAFDLFQAIVAATAAAHAAGVVHRDLKPENVLIADDGRIKVADFGLARAVSADTQHTATGGVLIGTVSYLAPELVVDGRSDARADVYALGVLLFELLTGTKPHEGESPIAVAYKHVHEDVPAPSTVVGGVPGYVDALVSRATARDRTHRQADAGVLLRQVIRVGQAVAAGVAEDVQLTEDLQLPPLHAVPEPGSEPAGSEPTRTDTREEPELPLSRRADPATEDGPEPTTPLRRQSPDATLVAGAAGDPVGTAASTSAGMAAGTATDSVTAADTAPAADDHDRIGWSDPTAHERHDGSGDGTGGAGGSGRGRRWRGPLAVVLAVLLVIGLGVGVWYFGYERYTRAPGVVGLTDTDAVAKLEAAGLDVTYADPKFEYSENSKFPEGTVLRTDPDGGSRIVDGSTVTLTLSAGKERYDVPKLRGRTEDEAQDRIADAHLVFGESTEEYSDDVPEGQVISSDPKAGESIHPRIKVDLVISKGPQPITVKDWTGRSADKVSARLERKGVTVEQGDGEYSDSVPEGDIISQSPTSGTVLPGETVTLTVSRGPELVEVPDVYLSGTEAATRTLEDAGFEVKVENAPNHYGLGFVTDQDPEGGSEAPKGSTITIYVI